MLTEDILDQLPNDLVFSKSTISAIRKSVFIKNDKQYIQCRLRKKDVLAKPEELIRQLWLYRLEHEGKYPLNRLAVEYPITFGRDTSKRADIVIFDAD